MQRLPGIHGLRAVAALGVVAFHVAYVPSFVTQPPVLDHLIPQLGLGVPLFFVLSAFSLAYSHDRSVGRSGWIWPYIWKRLFRIGPLFWIMMITYWYFWFPPLSSAGTGTWLINATFVFNAFPGFHESGVAAGWSIGVEMPFYLLLPLVLEKAATPLRSCCFLVGTTVVTIISRFWFMHRAGFPENYYNMVFTSYLATFACGIVAYRCYRAYVVPNVLGAIALFWLAALPLRSALAPYVAMPDDIVFWSAFFGLVTLWEAARPSPWLASIPMQWLGERSFSIYLLHPFVIFMLIRHGILESWWHWLQPSIGAWAYLPLVGLVYVITISASAVTYRLIERPGGQLGTLIWRCAAGGRAWFAGSRFPVSAARYEADRIP